MIRRMGIALVGLLLSGTVFPAFGAEKIELPGHGGMKTAEELSEECRQMAEKRQAMRQEMAAMDAKLEELTDRMNAATGDQKIEATAAVVNQLVAQHQAMKRHMETMGPEMMRHMAEHMQTDSGEKKTMMECPMMKSTEGGAPQSPPSGTHLDHHPK